MIKQVLLTSKLLQSNDSIISVPNTYANGAFPYWISNPKGATISKIKIMTGNIKAGESGGSFTLNLYKTSDASIDGNNPSVTSSGLNSSYIEDNWTHVGSIDYSAMDEDIVYGHEFKIVNINMPIASFILGTVDIVGDISIKDIFMWIEYTDNES